MTIDTNAMVSITGDFNKAEQESIASDEDVMSISKRLMAQNKEAYEVLAK
jgi:antitoxin Phd